MNSSKDVIVNRVAASSLVVFDLEELYEPGERVFFDLKPLLWQEWVLKEKAFREFVQTHDWSHYRDKWVALGCSNEAVIPLWAYLLVALALKPHAKKVVRGDLRQLEEAIFQEKLAKVDWAFYQDKKVVLKGCSKVEVPDNVYVAATVALAPRVSSLMFGEPCSTVPLWKKPKTSFER